MKDFTLEDAIEIENMAIGARKSLRVAVRRLGEHKQFSKQREIAASGMAEAGHVASAMRQYITDNS